MTMKVSFPFLALHLTLFFKLWVINSSVDFFSFHTKCEHILTEHELKGIFQLHTFMTSVINSSPDVEISHFNTWCVNDQHVDFHCTFPDCVKSCWYSSVLYLHSEVMSKCLLDRRAELSTEQQTEQCYMCVFTVQEYSVAINQLDRQLWWMQFNPPHEAAIQKSI